MGLPVVSASPGAQHCPQGQLGAPLAITLGEGKRPNKCRAARPSLATFTHRSRLLAKRALVCSGSGPETCSQFHALAACGYEGQEKLLARADGEDLHAATSSVCSSLLLCAPSLHLFLGWVTLVFLPPPSAAACVSLTLLLLTSKHIQ